MNNKRSYLDSINAGRRRRPNPSFQDMDRTLARLEGRGDTEREAYQAPRRNDRQRYRDEEFSNYPEQYERFEAPRGEARRDPLDSLARDMGRARQQEDSLGAVTRVASELQALREELRQQMGQGLRREFDSLRSDIERLSVMAPSANAGEIGAEFERLSDAVRSLSERSDDRSVNMLRLELEKVKGALGELAREETLRSVDRRWSSLESKIDRAPDRAQFEPTLKALNSQLERIGQAVDSLPESLSLRSLEDKLRGLAGTVDQFSANYGAQMPEAFALIEQRLDEITRAIAASASNVSSQHFDPEPFERIEARVSSLARQIEELAEDQTSEQVMDRLNALSHRVEEIAQRIEMPESAVEVLADQISAIAGKLEQDPARNYADVIFQGMEDRFAQISTLLEQRQGDAIEQGRQLFRELERRLETVSDKLDQRGNDASNGGADIVDAMERRFAELAANLETYRAPAADTHGMVGLEERLDDISRRLDNSGRDVAGIDPEVIRSLESQVAALSAHLDKPGQPLPEFEDISPRLDHIEQSLAQGREAMVEAARRAAQEAVSSLPPGAGGEGLTAFSAELKAFEELSRKSDERNAKTFETIHDTLLKIVDRLGTLEQRAPVAQPAPAPATAAPAPKAEFAAAETPSIESEFDDEPGFDMPEPAGAPQIRSPAQAAAAAAKQALGADEEQSEPMAEKRSMLGGLARKFRKDRKAADAEPAAPSLPGEPQLDEPLDPNMANQPIEPGTGAPNLDAIMKRVRSEEGGAGPASSMDAAKSDFIAAARRAAQAAAAEAEAMKRKGDGTGGGRKLGVGGILKGRSRTALMAATAIVVIVGSWQLGAALLSDDGPAEVAMTEQDAIEPTTAPLTAEMIEDDEAPQPRMAGEADTALVNSARDAIMSADPVEEAADSGNKIDERMVATEPMTLPESMDTAHATAMDSAFVPVEAGPVALREAADTGDAKAMFEIGNRYADGRGVAADMAAAAEWYERAAEMGYAPAEYRIGNLYERGSGVERDITVAMDWYEKAAKQGNASAMHNLAVLYAMGGTSNTPDNDRAARWFLEAAELGVTDSQYNLGILSAKGTGVPQSLEESYKWFALVAKTGDRDAAAKRDEVAKALRPEQLEKARQTVELWKARQAIPEANVADIPEEWTEGDAKTASVDVEKAVRNIQAILNNNGYDAGPADGVMGAKTQAAIKAFQAANGMEADGEVDDELVKALLQLN